MDQKSITPIIIAIASALASVWHSTASSGAVRSDTSLGMVEYVNGVLEPRDTEMAKLKMRIAELEASVGARGYSRGEQ